LYHNNLTRLVPIPQLTNTNSASQPLPSPLSNKVRLEYHVVYRIYSALLNTQSFSVLGKVMLKSLLLCNLARELNLICAFVEALYSPVFKLALEVS